MGSQIEIMVQPPKDNRADGRPDVLTANFLFGQIFFVRGTIQLAHGRSPNDGYGIYTLLWGFVHIWGGRGNAVRGRRGNRVHSSDLNEYFGHGTIPLLSIE